MVRFLLKTDKFIVFTISYNDFLLLLELAVTASHAGNAGSNPAGTTSHNKVCLSANLFSCTHTGMITTAPHLVSSLKSPLS